MDYLKLEGAEKELPFRLDGLAVKEFYAKTGFDLYLQNIGFNVTSAPNISTLAYCAIKSGCRFIKEKMEYSEEDIASFIMTPDVMKIFFLTCSQLGIDTNEKEQPKEEEGKESPGE